MINLGIGKIEVNMRRLRRAVNIFFSDREM